LRWLQKPFWFFRTVFRALEPARFSLIVAVIGGLVFLGVPQGVEVLRSLAEGGQLSRPPVSLSSSALGGGRNLRHTLSL